MKGFVYKKFKNKDKNSDSWGSYSDLFMVLSFIFLMMYVTASLRSGTNTIQQHLQNQKMLREAEDLRAQIKAYDALKDQVLKEESEDEQQMYNDLMDKLTLLQEEAKEEKIKLRKAAKENEKKEIALNKYQQMVRNIINANLLAKSKLKVREEIIDKKNVQITDLNAEVAVKTREIEQNTEKISKIESELTAKIASLNQAQKASKISKELAKKQIAELRQKSQEMINAIEAETKQAQEQIAMISGQLKETEVKLKNESEEKAQLATKLDEATAEYEKQVKSLKDGHEARMAREREAFEKKLAAEKISKAEKDKQLAEFNKQAKAKDALMAKQLSNLKAEMENSQQEASREISSLKSNLAEAEAKANAREKLSKEIAAALKKAGINADVDPGTGDVTIGFGDDYFDNDSAQLKQSMENILKKFIPLYSKNLFKDPSLSAKITSVEILGYASPTYKGKYVDPKSLSSDDQKAAKYNLDLSYQRARSIYGYMFDKNKLEYDYQKQLLPLVKVTGRSFFAEGETPVGVTPGMSQKEFCKKVDCKKAQKVIIKFNMDDLKKK